MRYDEGRYVNESDYVRKRPILTPAQVGQVQAGLNQALRAEASYEELTADQNNYPLADRIVHLFTTDASRTITGFANVGVGVKVIVNVGAQNLVLADDDVGSTEENRILTHTGADITLGPNESALIFYDGANTRVRTVGN